MQDIIKELSRTDPMIYDETEANLLQKLEMLEEEYDTEKQASAAYFTKYRKAVGHCKRLRAEMDDLRRELRERGGVDF